MSGLPTNFDTSVILAFDPGKYKSVAFWYVPDEASA